MVGTEPTAREPVTPPARERTSIRGRHVFITPYYREDRLLIERCIRSVQNQDIPADHMLVADGYPQKWLDSEPVRHIVLDKSHGDFGNAARGIGGLLAVSEGYSGMGFLDADNWLEKHHLSSCLEEAQHVQHCDFVIARRNWRRPNGMLLGAPDEPISLHVDTNCLYLLPGSFHLIPHFAMIPHPLAAVGDRIFYAVLRRAGLKATLVHTKTVNYHCLWASVYADAGEPPPTNAKPSNDRNLFEIWQRQQDIRELEIASRRSGLPFIARQEGASFTLFTPLITRDEGCDAGLPSEPTGV